jgi:hypothetical protein
LIGLELLKYVFHYSLTLLKFFFSLLTTHTNRFGTSQVCIPLQADSSEDLVVGEGSKHAAAEADIVRMEMGGIFDENMWLKA